MLKEIIQPRTEDPYLTMSYEDYLDWVEEGMHTEWVDGEVFVFMTAKDVHQMILGFLHVLINQYANIFNWGIVRIAPFEVKLHEGGSSREPDLFFISQDQLDQLSNDRFLGAPKLIVEIISQDSVTRDRRDKFNEYAEAGVEEYWMIDPRPNKQRADFYQRNEQGRYDLFATEEAERVQSRVLPDFWLKPDWLWQADTLNPMTVFFEMRGLSATQIAQIEQRLRDGGEPI